MPVSDLRSGQKIEVWWPNPVIRMASDVRTFETLEEARRFMESRQPKYGKFPGYEDPQLRVTEA